MIGELTVIVTLPREKGKSCHTRIPMSLVNFGVSQAVKCQAKKWHDVLWVSGIEEHLRYWGYRHSVTKWSQTKKSRHIPFWLIIKSA